MFPKRIAHRLVVVLWAVLIGRCIWDQAPGDGEKDAICTEEILDGVANPFFANRPVYSASEQPLMDSRDYNVCCREVGMLMFHGKVWIEIITTQTNKLHGEYSGRYFYFKNFCAFQWTQTVTATCAGTVTVCGFYVVRCHLLRVVLGPWWPMKHTVCTQCPVDRFLCTPMRHMEYVRLPHIVRSQSMKWLKSTNTVSETC